MNKHRITGFLKAWLKGAELKRYLRLPHGENPHQSGVFVEDPGRNKLPWLGNKPLPSFNNLLDAETINRIFDGLGGRAMPTAVIVKHAGPCGVASDVELATAYANAYVADSRSAYGGVVGLNRALDAATAAEIVRHYTVAVVCPAITDEAAAIMAAKPDIRILAGAVGVPAAFDARAAAGGLLMQKADTGRVDVTSHHRVSARTPTKRELADLRFAMCVARACYSNAVVLVRDDMTIGIGAGQPNRVDALWIALERARRQGHSVQDAVLASDGFFFPDLVEMAQRAGISAMVQPGGGKRDREVVEAADVAEMSLLFTRRRHFKH